MHADALTTVIVFTTEGKSEESWKLLPGIFGNQEGNLDYSDKELHKKYWEV